MLQVCSFTMLATGRGGSGGVSHGWYLDETEAIENATHTAGETGIELVTITARSAEPARTFSVRHFKWVDGAVHDNGWHSWVDGVFVGAGIYTDHQKGDTTT